MKVRLASSIQIDSIVDGEGLRTVIWMQGCKHNCKGCHNPETHDMQGGFEIELEELKKQIKELKNQNGITLSGGDPFFQTEASYEIAKYAKSLGLNVWCYTGFTFEQLLDIVKQDEFLLGLLKNIDILVDGKFIGEQKSLNLYFRGSKNQRILDIHQSLEKGIAVEIPKYQIRNIEKSDYGRKGNLYI